MMVRGQGEREASNQRNVTLASLRSRADKRPSILPSDATEETNITDVMQIKTVGQLVHCAKHYGTDLLGMIDMLRVAHDASIELAELVDRQEERVEKSVELTRKAQANANEARVKANEEAEAAMDLQDRVTQLEEENSSLKKKIAAFRRSGGGGLSSNDDRASPSSSTFTNSGDKKSKNHPDPREFTGDEADGPSWTEWYLKMYDKLSINADHWPNAMAAAQYTISRVGGGKNGAVGHINAFRLMKSDYFQSPEEVFDVLRDIYEDKNLRENARREYRALFMKASEPFAEFFSRFRKLGNILRYDDQHLIDDIKDKLVTRLRETLNYSQHKFMKLSDMRDYLQGVDNDQRATEKQKESKNRYQTLKDRAGANNAPRPSGYQPTAPRPAITSPNITVLQRPAGTTQYSNPAPRSEPPRCWKCGKPGFQENCPNHDKKADNIHELVEDLDMEEEEEHGRSENS